MAPKSTIAFQEDDTTAVEKSLLSYTKVMPNFDLFTQQLADCSSPIPPAVFETDFNPMNGFAIAPGDLLGQFLPPSDSNTGGGDSNFGSEARDEPQSPVSSRCNCSHLSVRQMLMLPFGSEEEGSVLDTQFARLKHAINVADECIGCVCASRDEMSIMTTSLLIGRIIEGFETIMAKAGSQSTDAQSKASDGPDDSSPGVSVPRLSWGTMQIEPDEEAELKQHMWRIQLRKLQGVIKKYTRQKL
ncbi:hypothetical protein Hte_008020 [Hypoxylon texense]